MKLKRNDPTHSVVTRFKDGALYAEVYWPTAAQREWRVFEVYVGLFGDWFYVNKELFGSEPVYRDSGLGELLYQITDKILKIKYEDA